MNNAERNYTPEEREILRRYVTDICGDVYCITNLPEEVVAVIFAYVSRSPLSFRENLLKLIKGDLEQSFYPDGVTKDHFELAQKRAIDFHRRITLGYGHSSVSELSTARVGIERISRLASAELELANPFISFIEYSQRYQKPVKGAFYLPDDIKNNPELSRVFMDTCNKLYDMYEEVFRMLHSFHLKNTAKLLNESDEAFHSRTEKTAFEDARYILPLATFTNLGMVANARAIRDGLVQLLSSDYPECRDLAQAVKQQVSFLLPTLLRHAEPSPYLENARQIMSRMIKDLTDCRDYKTESVELLDYTGKGLNDPESEALKRLLSTALNGVLYGKCGLSAENWVDKAAKTDLIDLFNLITESLGVYDNPLTAFTTVKYRFRFRISEANWHQLLRHSRKINFSWGPPRTDLDITIPNNVKESQAEALFLEAIFLSQEAFRKVNEFSPQSARYLVTNAHHRQIIAEFDLWELYHLINLRTTPEAQWDIRQTVEKVEELVKKVHPSLIAFARRRTKA
jgi:thymidylate synthase ThyX